MSAKLFSSVYIFIKYCLNMQMPEKESLEQAFNIFFHNRASLIVLLYLHEVVFLCTATYVTNCTME